MGSFLSSEEPSAADQYETNKEYTHSQSMSVDPQSLKPKELKSRRLQILNEILKRKAKLDESLVKENNAILKEFLDTFTLEMKKCNKTFDLLFQRYYFTGSFYSNLRVSSPDEFDTNICLKLPCKSNSISFEYQPQVPSYVKYRTTDESSISQDNGLAKLFENGYLMPNAVRVWLQSVVDKALVNYKYPKNVVHIKTKNSGPARTIILVKHSGVIDIDLVPAIECAINIKPPGIHGMVYDRVKNDLQCFLIPKPYQPTRQAPVSEAERARLWRTHYPKAESEIIHDLYCVKSVIKLLKLLRDKENWKSIASYYLKTVVMWMVFNNSNADYWKQDHLFERFLDALNKLNDYIRERKMPYFFSSRYNLLEKLSEAEASNISNRLCIIIKTILRDESQLWNIFRCPPSL